MMTTAILVLIVISYIGIFITFRAGITDKDDVDSEIKLAHRYIQTLYKDKDRDEYSIRLLTDRLDLLEEYLGIEKQPSETVKAHYKKKKPAKKVKASA